MSTAEEALELHVDGMVCGGCMARVRRALGGLEGVVIDSLAREAARLRYDPQKASLDDIERAIRAAGHVARPEEAR